MTFPLLIGRSLSVPESEERWRDHDGFDVDPTGDVASCFYFVQATALRAARLLSIRRSTLLSDLGESPLFQLNLHDEVAALPLNTNIASPNNFLLFSLNPSGFLLLLAYLGY